jgi:hypothetical protein
MQRKQGEGTGKTGLLENRRIYADNNNDEIAKDEIAGRI